MATYDPREATQLAALAAARLSPSSHLGAKIAAAQALFGELRGVFESTAGFYCARDNAFIAGDFFAIGVPRRGGIYASVSETEGKIFFRRRETDQLVFIEELDLPFDPATGRLTTDQFDSFSEPTPGQPRLRRSALAVAVERTLALIEAEIVNADARLAEAVAS